MSRTHVLLLLLGVSVAIVCVELPTDSHAQTASLPATGLMGVVKSSDGKPMEGVPVSAKADGSTITTAVYTDKNGTYYFPPLKDGQYKVWTQAVGFEFTRVEQAVSSSKKTELNLTVKPYAEAWRQLSDIEWFESLPNATAEDRRMKKVLLYNCGTCHNSGFVFEKRFDAAGWEIVINKMKLIAGWYDPPDGPGCCGGGHGEGEVPGTAEKFDKPMLDENGKPIGAQRRVLEFYAKDILAYLTRLRGPQSPPIQAKPLPRPTGETANIVVTEYDLPERPGRTLGRLDPATGHVTQFTLAKDGSTKKDDNPDYRNHEYRDGVDWSVGIRSQYQDGGTHDLQVGLDGQVYFGISQGIAKDNKGNIWGGQDMMIKFDTKAEKFTPYPMPKGMQDYDAGKDVDSKGNVYAAFIGGVQKLSASGEYSTIKAKSPMGRSYGLTVDAEDNVWFNQIALDKIGYIDARTGQVGEVQLPPLDEEITAADREVGRGWTMNQPLYGRGPRRGGADKHGDTVWANQFFAGRLAKIDIHTKKVTDYKLPGPFRFAYPYHTAVDKNHTVWFSLANADYLGKLDQKTGEFTFYPLPTRAHNARHIDVDDRPAVPEIWLPYDGSNKIARVQFRTNTVR